MTQQADRTWKTGWTAEEPIQIGYAWAPKDGGGWVPAAPGFERRDLGVAAASGGALAVHHVRVTAGGAPDTDWEAHDLDFDFLYVVAGTATMELADGEQHVLSAGTSVTRPPRTPHRAISVSD